MMIRIGVSVLCLFASTACGDGGMTSPMSPSPTPGPTPTTVFQGSLAGVTEGGPSQTGTLEVTVQTLISGLMLEHQEAAEVLGTLQLAGGGDPLRLTGSYDDVTRQLTVSGDGFVFAGVASADGVELSDTYTGPSGGFGGFAMLNSTDVVVTPYCGTYLGEKKGVWNMVISATGRVSGMYVNSLSVDTGHITGRLTGSSLEFTADGGVMGTAVLTGDSLSGTWRDSTASGTFAGSTGACQ